MVKQPIFLISQHSNSPKILFQTINRFLNLNAITIPPSTERYDKFLNVFSGKTKNVRSKFRKLDGKVTDDAINVNTFD